MIECGHVRVLDVIFQAVQVFVSLATVANGALIGLGSNILALIRDEVAVAVLVVVLEAVRVLVRLLTAGDVALVRLVSVGI